MTTMKALQAFESKRFEMEVEAEQGVDFEGTNHITWKKVLRNLSKADMEELYRRLIHHFNVHIVEAKTR